MVNRVSVVNGHADTTDNSDIGLITEAAAAAAAPQPHSPQFEMEEENYPENDKSISHIDHRVPSPTVCSSTTPMNETVASASVISRLYTDRHAFPSCLAFLTLNELLTQAQHVCQLWLRTISTERVVWSHITYRIYGAIRLPVRYHPLIASIQLTYEDECWSNSSTIFAQFTQVASIRAWRLFEKQEEVEASSVLFGLLPPTETHVNQSNTNNQGIIPIAEVTAPLVTLGTSITPILLASGASSFRPIHSFTVRSWEIQTHSSVQRIFRHPRMSMLRELWIDADIREEWFIHEIGLLTHLTKLSLDEKVPMSFFEMIHRLSDLTTLSFKNQHVQESVRPLPENITNLSFTLGESFKDINLSMINSLHHLRTLDIALAHSMKHTPNDYEVTENQNWIDIFRYLTNLTTLQTLKVRFKQPFPLSFVDMYLCINPLVAQNRSELVLQSIISTDSGLHCLEFNRDHQIFAGHSSTSIAQGSMLDESNVRILQEYNLSLSFTPAFLQINQFHLSALITLKLDECILTVDFVERLTTLPPLTSLQRFHTHHLTCSTSPMFLLDAIFVLRGFFQFLGRQTNLRQLFLNVTWFQTPANGELFSQDICDELLTCTKLEQVTIFYPNSLKDKSGFGLYIGGTLGRLPNLTILSLSGGEQLYQLQTIQAIVDVSPAPATSSVTGVDLSEPSPPSAKRTSRSPLRRLRLDSTQTTYSFNLPIVHLLAQYPSIQTKLNGFTLSEWLEPSAGVIAKSGDPNRPELTSVDITMYRGTNSQLDTNNEQPQPKSCCMVQ